MTVAVFLRANRRIAIRRVRVRRTVADEEKKIDIIKLLNTRRT